MNSVIKSIVEHFPKLALFYRSTRDFLDQRHPTRDTPWGFTFAGHTEMSDGSFEPEETKIVCSLLLDVDIFVNVGANVGYYCCHALSIGKPVIAIEPNARNLYYLLRNLNDNGWAKQAEVLPVAIGSNSDILQMWGGGTGASLIKGWANIPESYVTQVPILSLDRVLGSNLHGKRALILVDIEGSELMMLQGAQHVMMNEPRPIWMMEIATSQNQPRGRPINTGFKETFDSFFNLGYRAYVADEGCAEVTRSTVAAVVDGSVCLSTYNFLFK